MTDDTALRDQNVAIVREYIETINTWNFKRMAELLDEDAFFEMPFSPEPLPRSVRGRANILEFVETVPAMIDAENLHEVWAETLAGDPCEIVCTYKSDMEIKPKMTPYRNRYISRWTVRDGKVTYFAEYYDGIELLKSLGGEVAPVSFEPESS
jgi:ketosteroid isomerase-like protein